MGSNVVHPGGRRLIVFILLSVVAACGLGWGVIGIVNALESERCGPYGYGGYCRPFEVRVSPSAGLVDGQAVAVRGVRFSPSTTFGAAVCSVAVPGIDGCDLSNTALTTTDSKGQADVTLRVRRIITVQGRRLDCATSPCALGAGTIDGITPIEAMAVPISFDPSVPPVPPLTVRVALGTVTTRGMSGTITCSRDAMADVGGYVLLRNGSWGDGNTSASIACGRTPVSWRFGYQYRSGKIVAGPGRYELFASASDGLDYAYSSTSGSVTVIDPLAVGSG